LELTKSNTRELTGRSGADVAVEFVAVEFFNSKHAIFPASFVLLWQHVSIVQKPAAVASYCLIRQEKYGNSLIWRKNNNWNIQLYQNMTYVVLSDIPKLLTKGMEKLTIA
jgi:hypothetical protein